MKEDHASVKDQIVEILAYGATPVSSVEGLVHAKQKQRGSVCDVIRAYPDLFQVFARGFPETGPKQLWVRLKRVGVPGKRG
jgi:hypothetical protein